MVFELLCSSNAFVTPALTDDTATEETVVAVDIKVDNVSSPESMVSLTNDVSANDVIAQLGI